MANFNAELLDLPGSSAASAIALAYLDDAAAAAARLDDKSDTEALHDFRVAIRRMRVTLRGYPEASESLSKKQRAKLRKLARHTNPARDAEVQLQWFRERKARFTPAQRAALTRFRARLRAQRRRRLASTQRKLHRWFMKLERKLRRRLVVVPARAHDSGAPFRAVAAAALLQQAGELNSRMKHTLTESNPGDLHATRIAAKRLRYLLEPVVAGLNAGDAVVERLRVLQGKLGSLTDGHDLETALREDGDEGGGTRAALAMVRDEAEAVLSKIRKEWPDTGPDLTQQIDAIAGHLRPSLKAPPSMQRRTRRREKATV
jgi:CHAD domain-containing protein